MQKILLGAIRLYWRVVPMPVRSAMSSQGTSQAAYTAIEGGAGFGTFVRLALPLRKLGLYGGESDW